MNSTFSNGRRLPAFHLLVLLGAIFFHSLNISELLRVCLYLNLAIVAYYWTKNRTSLPESLLRTFFFAGIAPLLLMIFHFLAVERIDLTKELRSMIMYTALTIGFYICMNMSRKGGEQLKRLTICVALLYVLIQTISVFFLGFKNGTTKNPHYLAQYCLLLLPVFAYIFFNSTTNLLKVLSTASAFLLMALLLHTLSRPAWIGLILISGMTVLHQNRINRLACLTSVASFFSVLYLLNVENFGVRFHDLYVNIQTEERVFIWRDTLQMLSWNSPKQWLVGHGLGSFRDAFTQYSSFHEIGRDFNSPHNFVLELLYTSGVMGLIVVLLFFSLFYYRLVAVYLESHRSDYAFVLIAILSSNLVLVSITLPFFTSYNLLVCSCIGGLMLYFDNKDNNRLSCAQ